MNWVDLVITGALIFFALESLGRDFILELLDFLSFLLAFFISFSYYNLTARFFENQFQIPHGLSQVVGFMSMWFMVELFFTLGMRIILPKLPKIKKRMINIFAIVPATLKGLIFISMLLVMMATFPIQPSIKKDILNSKIGSEILKNAYALEQPIKNVFGGVSNDSLTFLTIKPKSDEEINLGFQTTNFKVDEVSEQEMMKLVNQERAEMGLKTLRADDKLTNIARAYSADMLTRGFFSHYSPEGESVADRAAQMGVDFLVIGENLAYAPSVQLAHKGLMHSEGHRANILSKDYGRLGIGVMDANIYGKMFTQVFAN